MGPTPWGISCLDLGRSLRSPALLDCEAKCAARNARRGRVVDNVLLGWTYCWTYWARSVTKHVAQRVQQRRTIVWYRKVFHINLLHDV